jgi:hypothetical protein
MTAADIIRIKELLPTAMGSDELREQVAADILRRSVFSARMESARYLAQMREVCALMMEGRISQATARDMLGGILERMGFSPQDGGSVRNPASLARLNLILDTQTQMAANVARLSEQTPEVMEMWPAWELTRLEGRALPRGDWPQRWDAAARSVGFEGVSRDYGRMVALKESPVWQALGDGAGGFRDTLGNPFPPFAFNSGMGWVDVTREECEELGLDPDGASVPAEASLAPDREELARAAEKWGFDYDEIAKGVA